MKVYGDVMDRLYLVSQDIHSEPQLRKICSEGADEIKRLRFALRQVQCQTDIGWAQQIAHDALLKSET